MYSLRLPTWSGPYLTLSSLTSCHSFSATAPPVTLAPFLFPCYSNHPLSLLGLVPPVSPACNALLPNSTMLHSLHLDHCLKVTFSAKPNLTAKFPIAISHCHITLPTPSPCLHFLDNTVSLSTDRIYGSMYLFIYLLIYCLPIRFYIPWGTSLPHFGSRLYSQHLEKYLE